MFIARQRTIETAIYQAKCLKTVNFFSTSWTFFLILAATALAYAVSRQDKSTRSVLIFYVANSEQAVNT